MWEFLARVHPTLLRKAQPKRSYSRSPSHLRSKSVTSGLVEAAFRTGGFRFGLYQWVSSLIGIDPTRARDSVGPGGPRKRKYRSGPKCCMSDKVGYPT